MKRSQRITLSSAVLLSVIVFFFLLTDLSREGEGPLDRVLTGLGSGLSSVEKTVAGFFRGPGREGALAWFEPARENRDSLRFPSPILLGAYDSRMPETLEGVAQLEEALGTTFPLIHFYAAWGDRAEEQFPERMMDAIWNLGSVPVVTWEPWLNDFESGEHPQLPLRDKRDRGGLAAIASGEYDFYIDKWASGAARFGKVFFLRFAHEMNDPYRYPWGPQNNSVVDFLEAWRHVHDRFVKAGATNVLWVWSPHIAYPFYQFYPGDTYVDWVGTGVLNYGIVASWSRWWSFQEIFGKNYVYLKALKKPVMIAEFGSLAVGGDRARWYRAALDKLPERHPMIKAVLFFNVSGDATVTPQALDWTLPGDSLSTQAAARAIAGWKER